MFYNCSTQSTNKHASYRFVTLSGNILGFVMILNKTYNHGRENVKVNQERLMGEGGTSRIYVGKIFNKYF